MKELLERISNGDEKAFRKLYLDTHKAVFAYIYRLCKDYEKAEEIMVKTYTEVWKSASKFKGESKVITWIYGIARNITMSELRKRFKLKEIELNENFVSSDDPFLKYAGNELKFLLKQAINELPFKYKEILDLVFFHGLKYEEISQILGIPVNTVKTRVFNAKKKLKEILNKKGVRQEDVF